MTKFCGGLIDYKEIHDSFYGVKSLVVQLDEIVHRYKTACEKTTFPSTYNDSIFNETKIFRSTPVRRESPQCRLDFPNISPISKDGDDKTPLCENPECPYAPPPACSSPHCPFRKQEIQQKSESPDAKLNICPNPECPYNETDSEIQRNKCCSDNRSKDDGVSQSVCNGESLNSEATEKSSDQEQINQTVYVSEDREEIDTTPCRPGTCFKHAGALECEMCLEAIEKRQKSKNRQKMQFTKEPYEWSSNDRYPGYHIGHQYCCAPSFRVPPKQGWLWNIFLPCLRLKPRIGWRPGAVSRRLGALIRKRRRLHERMLSGEEQAEINAKIGGKKPHLYVVKKQGDYMVTVNCIEDPKRKPLQFKIEKDAREQQDCYCDDDSESSSDGFDFEIKSPTRIKPPKPLKKPRKRVTKETQYNPDDFQAAKAKDKKGKGKKGKDKKKNKKKKK